VTNRTTEQIPAQVPTRATQAGDILARWAWTESSVWTERMLAALEDGVKGGRWFSLIDKVHSAANLRSAFAEVKANRGAAGVDHQTVEMFEAHLDENLKHLEESLRTGTYRPGAIRRVYIPKPATKEQRPLGIPNVRDRVAQAAVRHVLEPIFERDFAAQSYGFRPGRGCKDALRRVNALLHRGHTWVVDADLKSYLETATYCTPVHEGAWNRPGCLSITLIRRPLRLPQRTWTAFSSPRFTRCNTVCRETPSRCVASSIGR